MRRASVLILLAGLMAVPTAVFADAFVVDIYPYQLKAHQVISLATGYAGFNPATGDVTNDCGIGVLDGVEFDLLEAILANPSALHHTEIHAAWVTNYQKATLYLGGVVAMTKPSGKTDGANMLVAALVTMGEWSVIDWMMHELEGYALEWCDWDGATHDCAYYKSQFDLTCAQWLGACGDLDGDTVTNCKEYWGTGNWTSAQSAGTTTEGILWNVWSCVNAMGSTPSYKFVYNETTDRVYVLSAPMLFETARPGLSLTYPGGGSLALQMATVRNSTENALIVSLISDDVWVGGNDSTTEGTFEWVSGEPFTYTNWSSGEPNNAGNEDYLQFKSSGTWNDNGDGLRPVVFESLLTFADANSDHIPDAFADVDPQDNVPDGFGVALPTASFTVDVDSGDMPLLVTFTDTSVGNGPAITTRVWDFDDGSDPETVTGTTVSHTFLATGEPSSTFTVRLTVTTANGSDDVTRNITVNYVCEFDGALTSEGETLASMVGMLSSGLATVLNMLGMPTWDTWDIEYLPLYESHLVGDGLPDAAQMALIETVACAGWMDASALTYAGLAENKALFLDDIALLVLVSGDEEYGALLLFADYFAGSIGSSQAMKDTWNGLFLMLTEGATGLPSYAHYVVFEDGKAGELYSAAGDLDNDGDSNLTEWNSIQAVGGSIADFVYAATHAGPFVPGNTGLPVAGILGLGLLAGSMLAGAALAMRKK